MEDQNTMIAEKEINSNVSSVSVAFKILRPILIVAGILTMITNVIFFIKTGIDLHTQGITVFYLVLVSILSAVILLPTIFALPFLGYSVIKKDDGSTNILKRGIGYGLLGIFGSGILFNIWFFLTTLIYSWIAG